MKTRFIACPQSLGRIGKSTFNQALISFLKFAEVPVSAIDADEAHQTLTKWYPKAPMFPFREPDDLLSILNKCGQKAVEIVDFPAQATDQILEAMNKFRAGAVFAEKNVRMTIPLFASNEREALLSAYNIIQGTKDFADFVIVKNPARYQSDIFEASRVMEEVGGVSVVTLPRITQETLHEVDALSKTKGKALTFDEAIEGKLPIGSRMELEQWRNTVHANLQDIAQLLVPDLELLKKKVTREGVGAGRQKPVSAFDL